MRAAVIFPPQWDPRQPPLAPAVLAEILRQSGAEVRVFDANLAVYKNLLRPRIAGGIEDFLIKRLFDSSGLVDARSYLKTCEELQKIFDERFDRHGKGRLFWDTCGGLPSFASSSDWQSIFAEPGKTPFIPHLAAEIEDVCTWFPELICISAISDTQLPAALALASVFRRSLPAARILLGGSAITYRRSLLHEVGWLGEARVQVCPGPGEALLAASALPVKADSYPSRADFSSLPLAGYLTPHLVLPLETARGCPWGRCAFCIHPVRSADGRALYRPKPLQLVKEEINALFNAGHRRFLIVDEAVPPARLIDLSRLFATLSEPVSWVCYVRLDAGHTLSGFEMARASGCRKVFVGVESGSERILSRFNKGVDGELARRVIFAIASAGLALHSFLITGFPGEEAADRQATLDLLADVWPAFAPFGVSFDLFSLYGELETDLVADPDSFGWQGPHRDSGNDMTWQFPVISGSAAAKIVSEFKESLHDLANQIFGREFGLRHAALAQDSLHLLLLEAKTRRI